jgi:hypothetical protein
MGRSNRDQWPLDAEHVTRRELHVDRMRVVNHGEAERVTNHEYFRTR